MTRRPNFSLRTLATLSLLATGLGLTQCSANAPSGSTNHGQGGSITSSSGAGGIVAGAGGTPAAAGGSYAGSGVPGAGGIGAAGFAGSAGFAGTSGGAFASGGDAGATAGTGTGGTPEGGAGGALGGSGTTGGSAGTTGGSAAGTNNGGTGGTGKGGTGNGGTGGTGTVDPTFMFGVDISSVQEAVDNGAVYVDTDGVQKPLLTLLKNHGFNTVRLRAFVSPGAPYGYAAGSPGGGCNKDENYCDTAHTVEFAQQIKAAGMAFLLDLHYSDTWADPGKQIIPQPWRSAGSISGRATLLKNYTKDIVGQLIAAGARPDMVQVGNEITPGMLIHVPDADTDCWGGGSATTSPNGVASNGNWNNLATLLKAGTEGVRETDSSIKVMLHIENTDDVNGAVWWVDSALDRGVDFDVLGLSCYTAYQGQPSVWQNTFTTLATQFPNLEFVIAEYNPERTQANNIIKNLPNGRGIGTFFWEPTQSGTWGQSMFTFSMGANRAKAADFAEIDQIANNLGL
jgi:arabinogalactan endo-1,4-beta-galactosidase